MEKASPITLSHTFPLADPVGFLFLTIIQVWIIRLQKLYMRFFSILQSQVECLNSSWRIQREPMKNVPIQARGEVMLSREDVEMVMGRMGIACSKEAEQVKGYMGVDELSTMFEEKEPSLEEVKSAFRVFDDNNDGFIDAMELQRVLSKLGFTEGLALDDCVRMIAAHDENRDGRIDFNEFVKFMESSFC